MEEYSIADDVGVYVDDDGDLRAIPDICPYSDPERLKDCHWCNRFDWDEGICKILKE